MTPPPSPTSGQTLAPARAVLDVEGLATGTGEVCIATLEVLAHLFSWIDLSGSISTNLLDAIFSCAKYYDTMVTADLNDGIHMIPEETLVTLALISLQNGKQIEVTVQALTTINELLYRPLCSPEATDTLLLEIFQNGVGLFQQMERLDSIEERYLSRTPV